MKPVILAVGVGLVGVLLLYGVIGVSVPWSVAILAPVAGLVYLIAISPGGAEPAWRPLPEPESTTAVHQASTLASRFDEAATDPNRFRGRIQPRLRTLAMARLRQLPGTGDLTTLNDPRAKRLLGDRLCGLLTDPAARLGSAAEITALLKKLEELT